MTRFRLASRDTFRSLHIRNFRLFFTGQLISQTGTWMAMVAQTLLVLSMTRSGVLVGLLAAFQFGPVLLLGAWAGTVADRVDKQRLLVTVQTGMALQSLVLGVVVLTGHASLATIYALAAVQGVLTAFDNPTRRAFVVEMVPTADVPNAVSLNSAVMTGSRVFGPAMAGALVVTVGYGWAFVIDAISYVAVIAGLLLMRAAELHRSVPAPKAKGQVRQGLRYVHAHHALFVPLVMMTAIGTLAFNFGVTVPLLVKGPLDGGDGTFTLLFSAISLGSLVGALSTARRREVVGRELVVAAVAFGASMVGLALAPSLAWAFAAAPLLGYASIRFMTTATAIVQIEAAPEYRGRVLALQAIVFLGSAPIGGPLVGWLADLTNPRASIVVGALSCFGAAAWGLRALRRAGVPQVLDESTVAQAAEAADEAPVRLAG